MCALVWPIFNTAISIYFECACTGTGQMHTFVVLGIEIELLKCTESSLVLLDSSRDLNMVHFLCVI